MVGVDGISGLTNESQTFKHSRIKKTLFAKELLSEIETDHSVGEEIASERASLKIQQIDPDSLQ